MLRRKGGRLACVLILLSMACCARSHAGTDSESQGTASRLRGALVGKVVDSRGVAVDGAQVILMNRATNALFETVSDAKGGFRLGADAGAYDLGVFRSGSSRYAGPIVIRGVKRYKVTLTESDQEASGRVYGSIKDRRGSPLEGVAVSLIPNEGASPSFPGNASTKTDANGFFSLEGVPADYLTVALSGENVGEAQYIDILKEEGACRVDFKVDARRPNHWRPGMRVAVQPEEAGAAPEAAAGCVLDLAAPLGPDALWRLALGCGIGVARDHEGQLEIDAGTPCPIACWEIKVSAEKNWRHNYRISTWNTSFTSALGYLYYRFTLAGGQTLDSGYLWTQGEHSITFYSDAAPSIVKIEYWY